MKKYVFVIVLLVSFCHLSAQNMLRDAVVIVRPVYSEQALQFFKDFNTALLNKGYSLNSDMNSLFNDKFFCSGFIYKNDMDGRFYVITSRYITLYADGNNIEILPSGTNDKQYIKNCRIVSVHNELDLALIALPEDFKSENYLMFSSEIISEGEDVFSAGFPVLASEPVWQLGQGIISNADIYVEELVNGYGTSLIQHTAQISTGGFGGPLLLKDENTKLGFKVIGINMWTAKDRENTNFAIRSSDILEFLDSVINNKNVLSEKTLETAVENFVKAKNTDNYEDVLPFLSDNYLMNLPVTTFSELLKNISPKANKDVIKNFRKGLYIEGYRIVLADVIWQNLSKKNIDSFNIENFNIINNSQTVVLNLDDDIINSKWINEHGNCRIADISIVNTNENEKKEIKQSNISIGELDYEDYVFLGTNFKGVNINYYYMLWRYFSVGACLEFGNRDFLVENAINIKYKYLDFGAFLGVNIPISINNKIHLVPFGRTFFGMTNFLKSDFKYSMDYGFSAGIEIFYRLSDVYVFLGGGYKQKYFSNKVQNSISYPEICIGVSF